ncbi:hypothetical protein LJC22_03860 [Desulfosarcina sp. OttesenSCG-928-G10]|nr:hypothetical protein [Desulfosarcina sp. OttesenSCG-928-G10]
MRARPVRKIAVLLVLTIVFILLSATGALSDVDPFPETLPTPSRIVTPNAVTASEIQEALAETRASLDLQTEWPTPAKPPEPFWLLDWLIKPLGKLFSKLYGVGAAKVIFWGAIILIICVVLYHLQENLWSNSRSRRLRAEEKERAETETSQRMDTARVEAEALAGNGSFAEAMHVLLLESVNELRRRLDISIAASLTSREILRYIGIPPEGHLAFADIIKRVEISYFGLREPGEAEYLACRESFAILTRSLCQGGAP